MAARETLMIMLRERFAEYGIAREALLSVGFTVRQARRLWDGQARITGQVLERLRSLLSRDEYRLLVVAGDGMPSVQDALNAVEPVHASEYWITPQGIDLAETGLDAWAAWHMGVDGESIRTDAAQLLLKTHGYIAVCRTGDGPILIDWSESSVDPLALRHLRRALGQWGAAAGFRFGSDLARHHALPTLRDALRHVDQTLALRGHRQDPALHIEARQLPVEMGQGRLKVALDHRHQSLSQPRGGAAYPDDRLEHAVVNHVTDHGLVTAAIGRDLLSLQPEALRRERPDRGPAGGFDGSPESPNRTPISNATTERSAMNGWGSSSLKPSRRCKITQPTGYGSTTMTGPLWASAACHPPRN
jgi:hypothetical protein